eukprot:TRINITY_DN229_c1_g2_i1.p1 TRINITY_DN229_c1_g2~~TRINITY_DN229_c1_g2_i1.p1  ORF type:complete len:138 (+),score=15.72 TRINITY_DN229_c1_g2_i1:64-477(+)
MQELLILLGLGIVYSGVGFLMKAVTIYPYYGVATFFISVCVQTLLASRYAGKNKVKKGKWTFEKLLNRFLPVIMAGSILAGLAGSSGVVASTSFYMKNPTRTFARCCISFLTALLPLRNLRDALEESIEKRDLKKHE